MATEIAGSNISMNTATGPLVLKFDARTVVVRSGGSAATTSDIRPGMSVTITYDQATNIATRIVLQ